MFNLHVVCLLPENGISPVMKVLYFKYSRL